MKRLDHSMVQEWLDLEVDGGLDPAKRRRLESHLQACAECRRERDALVGLGERLAASRVAVGGDFTAEVASRLPVAGWEGRSPRTWALPLAVLALLATVSAGLIGLGSARMQPGSSVLGIVATLGDLVATSALAGAGLLSVSWKGLGLVVEAALEASSGGRVAFVTLVICLNLLFLSLLWRRRRPQTELPASDRRRR